jgi:hypothetical protein
MANCSIPSSTPAIGRTSTPLSRRSRKQNKLTCSYLCLADRYGSRLRKRRQATALQSTRCARKIQSAIRNQQSAVRRVKGAWWSSRSSKPLSVPHTRDRGRFDSYPLRQVSVAASLCRGAHITKQCTATQRRGCSAFTKEVTMYAT